MKPRTKPLKRSALEGRAETLMLPMFRGQAAALFPDHLQPVVRHVERYRQLALCRRKRAVLGGVGRQFVQQQRGGRQRIAADRNVRTGN